MININPQLQNLRFQLKNIDTSFENMIILMENKQLNNPSSQIKDMGIQMLNMGIQMLNIGSQIPDMSNDINIYKQIQNISYQIKSFEMQMNKPIPMQFGIGIQMPNDMINNIGMEIPKQKEIFFSTGFAKKIAVDYDRNVDDIMKIFFEEIKKPEFFEKRGKFIFIYNNIKINRGDKTKVKDYFKNDNFPIVRIVDIDNLIEK